MPSSGHHVCRSAGARRGARGASGRGALVVSWILGVSHRWRLCEARASRVRQPAGCCGLGRHLLARACAVCGGVTQNGTRMIIPATPSSPQPFPFLLPVCLPPSLSVCLPCSRRRACRNHSQLVGCTPFARCRPLRRSLKTVPDHAWALAIRHVLCCTWRNCSDHGGAQLLHQVARPLGHMFAGSGMRRRHALRPRRVAVQRPGRLGCSATIHRALRARERPSRRHMLCVRFRRPAAHGGDRHSRGGLHFGC